MNLVGNINNNNKMGIKFTDYILPTATETRLGGIKVGDNLTVEEDGTLNAQAAEPYELPIASEETLGGIKVGDNLTIEEDGKLSAKQPDLTDYVKDTDYANGTDAGVIKASSTYGLSVGQTGIMTCNALEYDTYLSRLNNTFISKGTLENVITGKELVDATQLETKQNTLTAGNNIIITNDVISSIPNFHFEVYQTEEDLPETGEGGVIYLLPASGGSETNFYDEYIWITPEGDEPTYEKIGTTEVDLSNYVKNTDYAGSTVGGVIKISSTYGLAVGQTGVMTCNALDYNTYLSRLNNAFISKGTLENVITGKQLINQTQLNGKQNTLTAGEGITIEDDVISATGGSDYPIHILHSEEGYIQIEEGLEESGIYICGDDFIYVQNYAGAGFNMAKGDVLVHQWSGKDFISCQDGTFYWDINDYDIAGYDLVTQKDLWNFDNIYQPKTQYMEYPSNTLYLVDMLNFTRENLKLDATTITIARANGIKENGGIFELIFTSPATATSLTYPDEIIWRGEDLVNNKFVPQANKRYWVTFQYDGKYVIGEARGVDL